MHSKKVTTAYRKVTIAPRKKVTTAHRKKVTTAQSTVHRKQLRVKFEYLLVYSVC